MSRPRYDPLLNDRGRRPQRNQRPESVFSALSATPIVFVVISAIAVAALIIGAIALSQNQNNGGNAGPPQPMHDPNIPMVVPTLPGFEPTEARKKTSRAVVPKTHNALHDLRKLKFSTGTPVLVGNENYTVAELVKLYEQNAGIINSKKKRNMVRAIDGQTQTNLTVDESIPLSATNYWTIQDAVDSWGSGNAEWTQIKLAPGKYNEYVTLQGFSSGAGFAPSVSLPFGLSIVGDERKYVPGLSYVNGYWFAGAGNWGGDSGSPSTQTSGAQTIGPSPFTLDVDSTAAFTSLAPTFYVQITETLVSATVVKSAQVTCTGKTATTFVGCVTDAVHTIPDGALVYEYYYYPPLGTNYAKSQLSLNGPRNELTIEIVAPLPLRDPVMSRFLNDNVRITFEPVLEQPNFNDPSIGMVIGDQFILADADPLGNYADSLHTITAINGNILSFTPPVPPVPVVPAGVLVNTGGVNITAPGSSVTFLSNVQLTSTPPYRKFQLQSLSANGIGVTLQGITTYTDGNGQISTTTGGSSATVQELLPTFFELNTERTDGFPADATGTFPGTGTLQVETTTNSPQTITCTGRELFKFTGCTGKGAVFNATIDNGSQDGTTPGTVMTVTSITSGTIEVGMILSSTSCAPGTEITAFGTGTGGIGTYAVNVLQAVPDEEITASYVTSGGSQVTFIRPYEFGRNGINGIAAFGCNVIMDNMVHIDTEYVSYIGFAATNSKVVMIDTSNSNAGNLYPLYDDTLDAVSKYSCVGAAEGIQLIQTEWTGGKIFVSTAKIASIEVLSAASLSCISMMLHGLQSDLLPYHYAALNVGTNTIGGRGQVDIQRLMTVSDVFGHAVLLLPGTLNVNEPSVILERSYCIEFSSECDCGMVYIGQDSSFDIYKGYPFFDGTPRTQITYTSELNGAFNVLPNGRSDPPYNDAVFPTKPNSALYMLQNSRFTTMANISFADNDIDYFMISQQATLDFQLDGGGYFGNIKVHNTSGTADVQFSAQKLMPGVNLLLPPQLLCPCGGELFYFVGREFTFFAEDNGYHYITFPESVNVMGVLNGFGGALRFEPQNVVNRRAFVTLQVVSYNEIFIKSAFGVVPVF